MHNGIAFAGRTWPYLLIMVNLAVAITVVFCYFISPYTGIMTVLRDGRAVVSSVDAGSPAYRAGIMPEDIIVDVNNAGVPVQGFSMDYDFVRSKKERRLFWKGRELLYRVVEKGKPVVIRIERQGAVLNVTLTPIDFPAGITAGRTWYFHFTGFIFLAVAFLVLKKKKNEASVSLFFIGSLIFVTLATGSADMYDIAYPPVPLRVLSVFNHIGQAGAVFSFCYFVLVFPRRSPLLNSRPRIIPALAAAACLHLGIDVTFFIDDGSLSYTLPLLGLTLLSCGKLVHDYVRETDLIFKNQIKWAVLGFAIYSLWSVAALLLFAQGSVGPSLLLLILPLAIMPVCLAVAVTRYHLMDIDNILDQSAIFGLTILILEVVELAVLRVVAHHSPEGPRTIYLSMTAMLLIVFLYLPIRNRVKRAVEHLFKRGDYDTEEELRKFTLRLGACDALPALEKFSAFARGLFGAEIEILTLTDAHAPAGPRSLETARRAMDLFASSERALREYFEKTRSSSFGYELAGHGVLGREALNGDFASWLLVPFFAAEEIVNVALLLPKRNQTAYSKKDRGLLDACAAACSHVLEAEEKRRQLEQERLRLAREIHDGIGSEFSGIISFCEKGERLAASAGGRDAAEVLAPIAGSARRGMQELRNIVWALNMERQSFGYLSSYIKRYAADLLRSVGITVAMKDGQCPEDETISAHLFLTAFRTVQESCHNILKHAAAEKVTIELAAHGGWMELSIEDNGRGISNPAGSKAGHGLKNLRKRAADIGGTIEFASSASGGTVVRARFPMK